MVASKDSLVSDSASFGASFNLSLRLVGVWS